MTNVRGGARGGLLSGARAPAGASRRVRPPVPRRDKVRPAQPLRRHFREKTRPARPLQQLFREKVRPASVKTPILGCFERAGRTFSRSRTHQATQGELFHAHAHIRPRRANFFAHRMQRHGDVETNSTTACLQQGTVETGITSAPEKCTENTHFAPAKVMAVSIPHGYKRAKAIAVSDNRTT